MKPALRPATLFLLAGLTGCGGDSTRPSLDCDSPGSICTVLGTGAAAFNGDERKPTATAIYYPIDLAFDGEGRFMVLDWNNQRVRRIDQDGLVRTIMGSGIEGVIEEGSRAIDATLHHTFSMDFDAAGNMYLAGNHVATIYRVTPDGIVHLMAGADSAGFGGDGGNARDAVFLNPCGIAVPPSGSPYYIADTGNHRVRAVGVDGTIGTIAGNGTTAFSPATGPGTETGLRSPYRVRYDPETGGVFVSDTDHHVVRFVDASGIMSIVAGTGESGGSGDGGPAAAARLSLPYDALRGPDGAVYVADTGNNRIRRVRGDGIIENVAGTGEAGYSGDGGPAAAARLNHPSAIRFDAAGNLWIADTFNNRIRVVRPGS